MILECMCHYWSNLGGTSCTWVASDICDHCIEEAILKVKVIGYICARGIIALAADHPMWAGIAQLHFSKFDEDHWIKLWRNLMGFLM